MDTCCIDKTNKAELSIAIKSMFRWYRNASRCYVYLPDVSSGSSWETEFRNSRWFTRGWTLQEMLAPRTVEFYAKDGKQLGDKSSLQQQISGISNIPISALQGTPLSSFTVNERLSWREHRDTKREEDGAYSMMGILHVYLAPLYGEGSEGAFRRLMQEVDKLSKCFRDLRLTDPQDDKKRIENTKGGLVESAYRWIFDNANFRAWCRGTYSRLLWIKGDPGKGKTMLLCGIIDNLQKTTSDSISDYFFQGIDARLNSATLVLRGLIYLVVSQQPSLVSHLLYKYDQAGASLFEDANAWVALSDIFLALTSDQDLKKSYLIIDALDECMVDLPKLLDLVTRTSKPSSRVKWLLSSRNDARIEQKLRSIDSEAHLSLELKENAEQVSHAVDTYIDFKLSHLESLQDSNLRNQIRDILRQKANGTFLWVALIVQELERPESWDPLQVVEAAPMGLHQMYDRMLSQIQQLTKRKSETCRTLLSTAANAYRPLHLAELGGLCGLGGYASVIAENTKKIVALCGSFLTIRDSQVYLVHQSAKDYLSDDSTGSIYLDRAQTHYQLFSRSLKLLSGSLKRDICGLSDPGCPTKRVRTPPHDPLATIRYSCIYWVDHLHDSTSCNSSRQNMSLQADDDVYTFLKEKFPYWLEARSHAKSISAGAMMMRKLKSLFQKRTDGNALIELISAAQQFIMHNQGGIASEPLQVYSSALLFSPRGSLIRQYFQHEKPDWITVKPEMDQTWGALLQTFENNVSNLVALAFSHDSAYLAAGSWEGGIYIFAVGSGKIDRTFEAYRNECVLSVALSSDSILLATISRRGTIKTWHLSKEKSTTISLKERFYCATFSHDLLQLATYAGNNTIKLWDVNSGKCIRALENKEAKVITMAFSPDSTQLATFSKGGFVKIWNLTTNNVQMTSGFDDSVCIAAFSPDLSRLALGMYSAEVKIWGVSGVNCEQILHCEDIVSSLAFSHDSTVLTTAFGSRSLQTWNTGSDWEQTLDIFIDEVSHMTFSHDQTQIASAIPEDDTIKIWSVDRGTRERSFKCNGEVAELGFSHDSSMLVIRYSFAVEIWSIGGTEPYRERRFSPPSNRLGQEANLWREIEIVALSQDSSLLAFGYDMKLELWDVNSNQLRHTLEVDTSLDTMVAFSRDSALLAIVSDCQVQFWNVSRGQREGKLRTEHRANKMIFDASGLQLYNDQGRVSVEALPASQTATSANSTSKKRKLYHGSETYWSDGYLATTSPDVQYPGARMDSGQDWIMYGNKYMLWLPPIHRPGSFAVSKNHVAIFEEFSGKLRIYRFYPSKIPGWSP